MVVEKEAACITKALLYCKIISAHECFIGMMPVLCQCQDKYGKNIYKAIFYSYYIHAF